MGSHERDPSRDQGRDPVAPHRSDASSRDRWRGSICSRVWRRECRELVLWARPLAGMPPAIYGMPSRVRTCGRVCICMSRAVCAWRRAHGVRMASCSWCAHGVVLMVCAWRRAHGVHMASCLWCAHRVVRARRAPTVSSARRAHLEGTEARVRVQPRRKDRDVHDL